VSEQPTPDSILQVGLGFWPSKILLSAVEMELFTDLAKGPFDYTGADCQNWMKEADFRETRVEHLAGPDSMVIGMR
jgi:hypothetical protein